MRKENLDQDLGWAPVQYPGYTAYDSGEWRIVTEDDIPVAIIFTNNTTSAGVSWLTQTELVMNMRRMFLDAAQLGSPAADAYAAVESKYAENLNPEQTGLMTGVSETLRSMMARMDESI